jgi:hypothetical protein
MHVIGLGWKQFTITWSHRGAKQSVEELAAHLRMIIREEKKLMPPKDPALEMPKRLELPIVRTATQQLMESDATARINKEQFRKEAEELQKQREASGKGSIFSVMQPLYCPELDELIIKRIDVLYSFLLASGEKVLRWCQGKVVKVLTEKAKPTVVVWWDPMSDVEGKEDLSDETEQVLPPRKCNKDVEGAWRMDINVRIVEDGNIKEQEGICVLGSDLNVDSSGSESESETDHSEVDTGSDSDSD